VAIDIVSRAAWDARAPKGAYSRLTSTKGVKVHYTGDRVDPAIVDDHGGCVATVKSIQKFHMDGNGWIDIGYTMVACPHRKVFIGRGPGHLPAANGSGLNSGHYAVLGLVGNAGLVEPTDGILHAILDAIEYLRSKGGAGKEIKGHRDGYPTDCPGDPLYSWIRRGAPRPGSGGAGGPRPQAAMEWPGRLLKYPPLMNGNDVRAWQARMKKLGYDIAVDGSYGPRSKAVCVRFQKDAHLDPDGIVGRLTWNAAFAAKP
jgi:hypothetical protein